MELVANGTTWVSCDASDMTYSEEGCSQVRLLSSPAPAQLPRASSAFTAWPAACTQAVAAPRGAPARKQQAARRIPLYLRLPPAPPAAGAESQSCFASALPSPTCAGRRRHQLRDSYQRHLPLRQQLRHRQHPGPGGARVLAPARQQRGARGARCACLHCVLHAALAHAARCAECKHTCSATPW